MSTSVFENVFYKCLPHYAILKEKGKSWKCSKENDNLATPGNTVIVENRILISGFPGVFKLSVFSDILNLAINRWKWYKEVNRGKINPLLSLPNSRFAR